MGRDSVRAAALAALLAGLGAMATPPPALAAGGAWQSIGPSGGGVNGLTIDPAAPATVYAAAGDAGLFKTLDGGRHWAHSDAGLVPAFVRQVTVDPVATSTLFAATTRGVWKSTDGGAHWAGPASGLGIADVLSLVIDPRAPSTLYAGGDHGVWKSLDGGASWFESSAGLRATPVLTWALAIDPLRPATLYAGTALGVFKSVDRGASWHPSRAGMGTANVLAMAVDPLLEGTVYAAVQPSSTSTARGLFVSTDGGASWTARTLSSNLLALSVFCLAVSPAAPRTVYACTGGAGLFKSTNRGRSWTAINAGLGTLSLSTVAVDPTLPDRLYAGASQGSGFGGLNAGAAVYKTASGGAVWTDFSNGIDALGILALAVDPLHAGTLYAGSAGTGLYATADDGAHWTPANAGLRGTTVEALGADPVSPGTLYAETERGFFASTDGGTRWSRPGAPFGGLPPMIVDPRAPATLFSAGAQNPSFGLFKTVDGGATWSPTGGISFDAAGLTIAPSDPGTLYLATIGFIEGHQIALLSASHDGGATFQSLPPVFRSIGAMAVDPVTATTLYLAGEEGDADGLWKSTDGGQTVSQLPGIGPVSALLVDPADPRVIYAGSTPGALPGDVLVSRDGGATWSELAPGLPGSQVLQLAFGPTGALYAGTRAASIWRLAP
jgi:photosystem II stability/assembly factor-like uncharacterized protein